MWYGYVVFGIWGILGLRRRVCRRGCRPFSGLWTTGGDAVALPPQDDIRGFRGRGQYPVSEGFCDGEDDDDGDEDGGNFVGEAEEARGMGGGSGCERAAPAGAEAVEGEEGEEGEEFEGEPGAGGGCCGEEGEAEDEGCEHGGGGDLPEEFSFHCGEGFVAGVVAVVVLGECFGVVDEESGEVEEGGHPEDGGDDVERFEREVKVHCVATMADARRSVN